MRIENRIKTKIKICGLRRREDILAVNESGPDYCGFIIEFPKSFRSVTAEKVRELVKELSSEIQPVGVFVNEDADKVVSLLESGVIDLAQLHGNEDASYLKKLREKTKKPLIQAVRAVDRMVLKAAEQSTADYIMADSGAGTGKTFDWKILSEIRRPYFLAGGLDEKNVGVAIKELHPFAVDVSSGIETDGKKDPEKIEAFIRAVRQQKEVNI